MSLTLLEASKLAPSVQAGAVIEMFARESDILRALTFRDIAGNAYRYNQESSLPGIAFRGVNESYTESTGVINPKVESLYICGGDLDVDTFVIKTQGMGARTVHEQMKIKAIAADWTRVFVKGDSTSNPREFDGLQNRLTGSQLIANGASSGGDALSLANLDATIDAVDNPTHILMTKAVRRLITAAARNPTITGYITYDADAFGRRVTKYNDIPIIVPYAQNGGIEPIGFNEANPGGGSAVGTSVYVLSIGTGMLEGIQSGTIDARDLGEIHSSPVYRTRVEWYPGIVMEHGRAAARLYGIKNAAVVV